MSMDDWSQHEHAGGPATDVPPLLDRIAAGEAAAVDNLANLVAHQGWASCAVAIVLVPILWELACKTEGKTRAALVRLLGNLACMGDNSHFAGRGFGADEFIDTMLAEPGYGDLRAAVVVEAGSALGWLDDHNSEVRSAAAMLLGVTAPDGATAALQARLEVEKSPVARSDMLVALGWLPNPDIELLRRALTRKGAERFGAAVALAMTSSLTEDIAMALVTPRPMKGSAWCDGDIATHGVIALVAAAERQGSDELLHRAFGEVADDQRGALGAILVKLAFADRLEGFTYAAKPLPPPPFESLTAKQRDLLELLIRFDSGWGKDQGFWLRHLGFADNPVALSQYLGHPVEPTIVDREVVRDGEPTTYRDWICPELTEGADVSALAAEVAATLSPHELLELLSAMLRVDVPWGWTFQAFTMHALVAKGEPMIEPLRDAVARLAADGAPRFWDERGGRRSAPGHIVKLFAALKELAPSAQAPRGFPFDDLDRRMSLDNPAKNYGPQAAVWIERVLR